MIGSAYDFDLYHNIINSNMYTVISLTWASLGLVCYVSFTDTEVTTSDGIKTTNQQENQTYLSQMTTALTESTEEG